VALTVSGLTDEAGNVAKVASSQTTSFVIDNTLPTVALTYSLDGTTFSSAVERPVRSGDSVTVKATFVEENGLMANPRVTLTQTGNATGLPADVAMSGSGLEWTTTYAVQPSQNATIKVSVAATDNAGNSIATQPVTAFVIDNAAPGLSLSYSRSGSTYPAGPYRSGDIVTVTATFTEASALQATPTFTLVPGTFVNGSLPSVTMSGTGLVYSGTFTIPAGDGTVTATVGAVDTAGNSLNAAGQPGFTIDNTPPSVTLSFTDAGSANPNGPYKASDSVTVTATFTETNAISGMPTLSLVAGTFIGGTLPTVTLALNSGTTYSGTFTIPPGDGTVTATVGAVDTAGNTLSATGQTGFTIDNVAPTASLAYSVDATTFSGLLSRPVKSGDTVTIRATMTEAIALSAAPTITLTSTGGVTTVTASTMTQVGSSLVYTYAYTVQPNQNGTVSASVSAIDTASNALASTAATAFTVDNTAPTVVLAYSDGGSSDATGPYKSGDSVTVTATFTETNAISGTPTFSLVAGTFTGGTLPTVTLALSSGTIYSSTFTIPAGNGSVTATVGATDTAGNGLSASGLIGFTVDNTNPTFASMQPPTTTWYAGEAPSLTLTFSEPVIGVASSSFTLTHGPSVAIGAAGDPSISSIASECLQNVPVVIGLKGATGDGTASSTFILTFVSTSGITDCAGNSLNSVASGTIASGTFVLNPGTRPAPASGGGSNNDSPTPPAPIVRPVAPVTTLPPAAGSVPLQAAPPPPNLVDAGPSSAVVAAAFSALPPAQARAIGAALAALPPQAAQGFGAALGSAGAQAAAALLTNLAELPTEQVAAVAAVSGALPAQAAAALVTTLASLPPAQLAAVADVAASLPATSATQVFAAIAALAQPGAGPISFAPPAAVERSSTGQETVSFDLGEETTPSAHIFGAAEVAGVRMASTARRTVVILVKPGQVGVVNRPKAGTWPDVALPVTSGAQAGLTPIFAIPSGVTSFSFEPTPGNLNVVQLGSVGGGTVVPLGSPFAVRVTAPTAADETTIGVQMPSLTVGEGETFAYLFSTGGGIGSGFVGYLRAPAEFDAPTGRQKWIIRVDEASDVLFLPVALQPAFVSNHVEDAHIYSSAFDGAIDFGAVGEQFSTLTVVAPQVAGRIYVYNSETKGYGWVNANEVGPASPPGR
jgi:hypothetical protein